MRGLCHPLPKFCWVLLCAKPPSRCFDQLPISDPNGQDPCPSEAYSTFPLGRKYWLHSQESQHHLGVLISDANYWLSFLLSLCAPQIVRH